MRRRFEKENTGMDEMWQFPHCWSAIDGCHVPIECPPGGSGGAKKNPQFYSVVAMALVDSHSRFVLGTCGFPGNSCDSIIFQSTELWRDIMENNLIPCTGQEVNKATVPPLIIGDSAFPLTTWLMKPYTNATLTVEQRYFNYRFSLSKNDN